jgi:lysozyme family protein
MQTGGTQAAMAEALKRNSPQAQRLQAQLETQMFREPKWEKSELPDANGNVKVGWVNVNSPNPASTFIIGGTKPDVELAKGRWEGYLPQGGGFGPQSNAGTSAFAPAMAKVFSLEGDAFVPKDGLSGAPAKFGINQKANPDIDVKNLTKPQAEAIYKTRYWDAIGGDALPAKTAEIAFDAAVNQGPAYAKQLIAQTGGDPVKMLQQRAQDYTQLVQSNPAQAQFLPSWMNRLQVLSKDLTPQQETAQAPQFKTKAEQEAWLTGQRKTAELKAEAQNALPAALQTAEMGLTTINKLIGDATVDENGKVLYGKQKPHPGFEGAVGISGIGSGFGAAGYIPGTDVSNFKSKFKQLEGQAFLQAINSLRGTGAISEKEGASATAAITDMNLSQSESEFVKSANELRRILQKGYTAAQQRAGVEPATPNAQPSTGAKLRWNPQTNSFVQ